MLKKNNLIFWGKATVVNVYVVNDNFLHFAVTKNMHKFTIISYPGVENNFSCYIKPKEITIRAKADIMVVTIITIQQLR